MSLIRLNSECGNKKKKLYENEWHYISKWMIVQFKSSTVWGNKDKEWESWTQWHNPIIPELRKPRQEDEEVETSLTCTASSRSAWALSTDKQTGMGYIRSGSSRGLWRIWKCKFPLEWNKMLNGRNWRLVEIICLQSRIEK